jgi:cytochrome P450
MEQQNIKEYTDTNIIQDIMTFLFAGHETTSTSICWTLYLISINPEIEKKARQEIDSVLCGQIPTLENIAKLNYISCIIQESLRLYPPQPAFVRRSLFDTKIGNFTIPQGVFFFLFFYLLIYLFY